MESTDREDGRSSQKADTSFWRRLIEWVAAPPLSVRLLQAELDRAHAEIARLNNLVVQQLELGRIVPIQPERQDRSPAQVEQLKSYGEIQAEATRKAEERYQVWQAEETERLRLLQQAREPLPPN